MRFFLLFILICLSFQVPAEPYVGYGISQGDRFEYFFTFNHIHISDKTEIYDNFDLREIDFWLNDSLLLDNASNFQVEIGKYKGPSETRPFQIPGWLISEHETISVNDIPWMLLHNTEWGNYWSNLFLIFNHSSIRVSESFTPYETPSEIGFDLEWRVDFYPRDKQFSHSARYDKITGMVNYFKLDIVNLSTDNQGNEYTSLTNVIFVKTGQQLKTNTTFKIYFGSTSFGLFLIILGYILRRSKS